MNRNLHQILDRLLGGSPVEWIVFLVAVALIAVAVWAVARFRASLRDDADPAAAESHLLRHVRDLRERGDVSEEEYRSLKGRLGPPADGDPPVGRAAGGREPGPQP